MDIRSSLPVWGRQLIKPGSFHRNLRRAMHLGLWACPALLPPVDRFRNRRWQTSERRFLVLRYARKYPLFYEIILRWIAANFPAERRRFELLTLPIEIGEWDRYALHIPWIQDPVRSWSIKVFDQAVGVEKECERRGIPVVNSVAAAENTTRTRLADLLAREGVPVARTIRVTNPGAFLEDAGGLRFPLFVREDRGHRNAFYRADSPPDLARIPWPRLKEPVAAEIVDARSPADGLYRKYRYVAAGDWGCLLHVQFSREWITRGENMVVNDGTRAEELALLGAPDPNHELLQRARRALGLDFAAFDYGYDPQGRLIVWEANAMPFLHFGSRRLAHRTAAMHRIMAAILRLYLTRAGLPRNELLEEIAGAGAASQAMTRLRVVS